MSALDTTNKQQLEEALSRGLVAIAFEKKATPGNECFLCKKPLWRNPDPRTVAMPHEKKPYGYADNWQAAGDGVAQLACNHHIHNQCFLDFGKDPKNQRPPSNPMVKKNLACPECGHGCSLWTSTGSNLPLPRSMTCTRNLSLVPPQDHPKDTKKHSVFETSGAVRVYEISFTELGEVTFVGWKSFRMDKLVDAELRNQHLVAYVKAELAHSQKNHTGSSSPTT